MNATELSGQLTELLAAGEWAEAARRLAAEWAAVSEWGLYRCELPEQPAAWVQFKTTGYPFKLRRQWEEAKNDAEVLALVLPRVERWSITGANGEPLADPQACLADLHLLDELEEALLMWLTRCFWDFWRVKLLQPRKN